MTSSISTSVAVFFVVFVVWAANLVCYHPATGGLDPTSLVSVRVAVE